MDNQQLTQQFTDFADRFGITKAADGVINTGDDNFGGIMPRQSVLEMLDLTRKRNEWLNSLDSKTRQGASGTVPIMEINEPVSEGVEENDSKPVTTKPPMINVPFMCKKFKSEYYITTDELNEAAAAGLDQFESKMIESFATAIGNDKANVIYNGDKSLGSNTRLDRLLNQIDGIKVKSELGNIYDASGALLTKKAFPVMLDHLPDIYAEDPNLRWLFNRRVNTHYDEELGQRLTILGDNKLTTAGNTTPLGIPSLIVPHIHSNMGSAPIDPTGIVDNTSYITIDLTTLVATGDPATAALGVGRKFKVTLKSSGLSEVCKGYDDAGILKINTVGLLGQTTVSTTAGDYQVSVADETEIILGNPKGITIVDCLDMRSYRVFNPKEDRHEITTFWKMDVLISNPAALVKMKRLAIPALQLS